MPLVCTALPLLYFLDLHVIEIHSKCRYSVATASISIPIDTSIEVEEEEEILTSRLALLTEEMTKLTLEVCCFLLANVSRVHASEANSADSLRLCSLLCSSGHVEILGGFSHDSTGGHVNITSGRSDHSSSGSLVLGTASAGHSGSSGSLNISTGTANRDGTSGTIAITTGESHDQYDTGDIILEVTKSQRASGGSVSVIAGSSSSLEEGEWMLD